MAFLVILTIMPECIGTRQLIGYHHSQIRISIAILVGLTYKLDDTATLVAPWDRKLPIVTSYMRC
jgi:hypothetical protein